jgi:hypothetical protein
MITYLSFPSNKGKSMNIFPHGFVSKYTVVEDSHKLLSIVYYLGKRGYKFSFEIYHISGVKGHTLTIFFKTKRQYTYFKKRFG